MQLLYQINVSQKPQKSPACIALLQKRTLAPHTGSELVQILIVTNTLAELLRFLLWFIKIRGENWKIRRIGPSMHINYVQNLCIAEQRNASSAERIMATLFLFPNCGVQPKYIRDDGSLKNRKLFIDRYCPKRFERNDHEISVKKIENSLSFKNKRIPKRGHLLATHSRADHPWTVTIC